MKCPVLSNDRQKQGNLDFGREDLGLDDKKEDHKTSHVIDIQRRKSRRSSIIKPNYMET